MENAISHTVLWESDLVLTSVLSSSPLKGPPELLLEGPYALLVAGSNLYGEAVGRRKKKRSNGVDSHGLMNDGMSS